MADGDEGGRTSTRAKARVGKKAVVGYFTPTLSQALHDVAAEEGVSMQSLLGEALDMLLVARGRTALGER